MIPYQYWYYKKYIVKIHKAKSQNYIKWRAIYSLIQLNYTPLETVCFISINLLPAMIRIKRCLDTLMLFIFLQTLAIIPSKLYDSCLQNHPLLTIDMWYFEDWPQICATLHQIIHLYAVCASNAHSFLRNLQAF